MAITSWPFDNADTDEGQYTRLMSQALDSGVADSFGSTSFQVVTNIDQMAVNILAGFAIVRGHAILSTSTEVRAVNAAHSSLTRYDYVVLRLDPTANSITIEVKPGTAGAGSPPSLEQTVTGIYEMPLAILQINPGVGVVGSSFITDMRSFVGTTVGEWTTQTRPSNPRRPKLGRNASTGKWEYWNGSNWVDLIPSQVENSTRWNGYRLDVSPTTPAGSPTTDRIWIQPLS